MSSYEHYPNKPMAKAQPYSYKSASTPASFLRDPMDRFGSPAPAAYASAPQRFQELPPRGQGQRTDHYGRAMAGGSRWNPRNWTRRTMIIVGVVAIIIIIIIIVGAAVGSSEAKSSSYPNYTALSYSLADTYQGTNFYSNWDYWDTYDPALGFVHYDNAQDAANNNLTGYNDITKTTFLRVDNTEENASTGRHSARVSTRTTYDSGLFIFDIAHTPYGCASWPAVWLTNQYAWPNDGEIDVIEAVNQANGGNQMSLHTTKGCTMKNVKREMSGTALQTSCLNSTNSNEGCGVQGPSKSFGSAFNDVGGGVYAMELRDAGIRMWLFYRDEIPADITNGTAPNPANWGEAVADFPSTDCDISSHFKNLSIVANIDVCGSFAGSPSVYSTKWSCPGTNCTEYAAQNPSAFNNAFWSFNYFKVFKAA